MHGLHLSCRMSRHIRPPDPTLGWNTSVMNRTFGGLNGYSSRNVIDNSKIPPSYGVFSGPNMSPCQLRILSFVGEADTPGGLSLAKVAISRFSLLTAVDDICFVSRPEKMDSTGLNTIPKRVLHHGLYVPSWERRPIDRKPGFSADQDTYSVATHARTYPVQSGVHGGMHDSVYTLSSSTILPQDCAEVHLHLSWDFPCAIGSEGAVRNQGWKEC